jgi:hypothetical protein
MEWTFEPVVPASTPPAEPRRVERSPAEARPSGLRRAILTAAVSGLLLVAGGVAVVSAASPDPSSAPSTTTPGTTAPSGVPGGPRTHSGSSVNCPNMGGSSGSGGSGNSGSSAPATTSAT